MINENFGEFVEVWSVAQEIMANGKQLSNAAMKTSFRMLQPYSIENVTAAIYKHIETMKFAPQVSDIRDLLTICDKHLSADEAWLLTPKDESQSVVWTREMATAWASCSEMYYSGDVFSATRGYKSVYSRLVSESDLNNSPIEWVLSKGSDLHHLTSVIKEAVRLNRIPVQKAQQMLALIPTNENVGVAGLLSGNINTEFAKRNADKCKVILDALKEIENREAAELARIETRRLQIIAQAEAAL